MELVIPVEPMLYGTVKFVNAQLVTIESTTIVNSVMLIVPTVHNILPVSVMMGISEHGSSVHLVILVVKLVLELAQLSVSPATLGQFPVEPVLIPVEMDVFHLMDSAKPVWLTANRVFQQLHVTHANLVSPTKV